MEALEKVLFWLKATNVIKKTVKNIDIRVCLVIISIVILYIMHPSSETKEYNTPSSNCWERFIRKGIGEVVEAVDYQDYIKVMEAYSTANLICGKKKVELLGTMSRTLSEANSNEDRVFKFREEHNYLLGYHLAATGEECFLTFCQIFLSWRKYNETGLNLCKSCKQCCSSVLNGNWSYEGNKRCSVTKKLELQLDGTIDDEEKRTAVFYVGQANEIYQYAVEETGKQKSLHADACRRKHGDCVASDVDIEPREEGTLPDKKYGEVTFVNRGSSCDKWFKVYEEDLRKNFDPIEIKVVATDINDCQTISRRCLVVEKASLVCDEVIVAHLLINVEEEAVNQEKLIKDLADKTNSSISDIRLVLGLKRSTSFLLLMSPQAGIGLLTIVGSVEKKRLLLNALSTAVCSTMDYVSVSVRISGLQPIRMFFVPKGSQIRVASLTEYYILHIILGVTSILLAALYYVKYTQPKSFELLNRFIQPHRVQGLNNPNGGQHHCNDHMANKDVRNLDSRNDLQKHPNDNQANRNNGLEIDGLDELRKEVVESFSGQKILLVGPQGSGKSSLINTFDMVLHLTDPKYPFMEWAVYGPGKTDEYKENPTTFHYRKYHIERLYKNLEKFLGDTPPEKCPTFLDTTGFRRTGKIREDDLLVNIASGNMPEDTELLSIMEGEKKCDDVITEQNKELQSWSIVFVAGASIDFPKEIAHVCYAASEKLERTAKDVRLFAVVTKLDELSPDMRKTRLDEMQQEIEDTLAIPPTRIFHIRNITPEDVNEDETVKFDTDQRRDVLRALKGILNPSQKPDWVYRITG